jgi:hypothetical protein
MRPCRVIWAVPASASAQVLACWSFWMREVGGLETAFRPLYKYGGARLARISYRRRKFRLSRSFLVVLDGIGTLWLSVQLGRM